MLTYYKFRPRPAKHVKRLGSRTWYREARRLQQRLTSRTWLIIQRDNKVIIALL